MSGRDESGTAQGKFAREEFRRLELDPPKAPQTRHGLFKTEDPENCDSLM